MLNGESSAVKSPRYLKQAATQQAAERYWA